MDTITDPTASSENVKAVRKLFVRVIATRIAVGVGVAVASHLIANAIVKKLDSSDETPIEDNLIIPNN